MRDTSVPIPNTTIKPQTADNTWWVTAREDRWLPDYFNKTSDWSLGIVKNALTGTASNTIFGIILSVIIFVLLGIFFEFDGVIGGAISGAIAGGVGFGVAGVISGILKKDVKEQDGPVINDTDEK